MIFKILFYVTSFILLSVCCLTLLFLLYVFVSDVCLARKHKKTINKMTTNKKKLKQTLIDHYLKERYKED